MRSSRVHFGSLYAHARLIAAAPELYEALLGAVEWYEAIADSRPIEPGWVGLARAALAKAQGDEP